MNRFYNVDNNLTILSKGPKMTFTLSHSLDKYCTVKNEHNFYKYLFIFVKPIKTTTKHILKLLKTALF